MKFMRAIVKTILSLVILVIALVPFWLWLGLRHLIQPEGFWQNLVFFGLGWYFFWAIQAVLLVTAFVVILYMASSKDPRQTEVLKQTF